MHLSSALYNTHTGTHRYTIRIQSACTSFGLPWQCRGAWTRWRAPRCSGGASSDPKTRFQVESAVVSFSQSKFESGVLSTARVELTPPPPPPNLGVAYRHLLPGPWGGLCNTPLSHLACNLNPRALESTHLRRLVDGIEAAPGTRLRGLLDGIEAAPGPASSPAATSRSAVSTTPKP